MDDTEKSDSEYTPPDVWDPDTVSGGEFASINRPTAGQLHQGAEIGQNSAVICDVENFLTGSQPRKPSLPVYLRPSGLDIAPRSLRWRRPPPNCPG